MTTHGASPDAKHRWREQERRERALYGPHRQARLLALTDKALREMEAAQPCVAVPVWLIAEKGK